MHRRYVMSLGGSVYEARGHRPWFLSDRCPGGALRCSDSVETIMVWDDSSLTHVPGPRAVRVEALQPGDVPALADAVERAGGVHSFSNVRYEARLSLDVYDGTVTMFGARAPVLASYGGDEYAGVLAEVYERAREALRIAAVDIEVASSGGGFPRPGDRVFLVTVGVVEAGEVADTIVLEGDGVYELPRVLRELRPHLVAGFNSSGFDARYYSAFVGSRVWQRQLFDADGLPLPHIDLMEFLDAHGSSLGLSQGRRYALDDAASALGLASPEELEVEESVDRSRIWEAYLEQRELVVRYARTDAVLTARLAAYVAPVLAVLAAFTGIAMNVIPLLPSLGSLAEYAVYEAVRRRKGIAFQVRRRRYEIRGLPEREAGIVYSNRYKDYYSRPYYGEGVAEYDFNMLYPSIYSDKGLGPLSRSCADGFPVPLVSGDKVRWERICGGPGDPVAETLTRIYDARRATKRLKRERGIEAPDQAVKILANSAYGMYSKGRGMGIHEGVAGYIFFYANYVMDKVVRLLESRGLRVVYTATDSLFVEDVGDPEALASELNEWVRREIGARYSLKLEAVFEKLALVKKKTYVGRTVDGTMVVKGMEKLQIPRGVKESLGGYFSAVLDGADPRRAMLELLRGLPERLLWVRTSKTIADALWDSEEARWKTLNNPGMRAIVATHMLTEGRTAATYVAGGLPDYTVIAWWLPLNGSRLLLDTPRGRFSCRVHARPVGREMRVQLDCSQASPSRADLERLAYARASVIVGYGETIVEAMRGARTLDEWLRG